MNETFNTGYCNIAPCGTPYLTLSTSDESPAIETIALSL